jgi:hypothetical protein
VQFAGSHLLTSLLSFNVGVELGQLLALAFVIPALALLFRYVVAERVGMILLSAFVAHTAWHWMIDRGSTLGAYQFSWPAFDLSLLASSMRGLILLLAILGAAWLTRGTIVQGKLDATFVRSRRAADNERASSSG